MHPSRLLLATPAVLVGLLASTPAQADSCQVNRGALSCTDRSNHTNSIDGDWWAGSLGQLFTSETYDSCGGSGDYDQGQDVYPFVCPPGGTTVSVNNFSNECDVDLFVLEGGCSTNDCVDGSANGGKSGEFTSFACEPGSTYYVVFERNSADIWGSIPIIGLLFDCNNFQDVQYSFNLHCVEDRQHGLCDDRFDNDQDGLYDCLDPDCPLCMEFCDNNLDDDFDNLVDCADDDCKGSDFCCDRDHDDFMANTGICIGDDCNDNPVGGNKVNPGAQEIVADNMDSNCDGKESCYIDQDGDHWGILATKLSNNVTCLGPGVANKDPIHPDCNDGDANISPGVAEIPANGIDENCDGMEDCYTDNDADGYGIASPIVHTGDLTCTSPGVSNNADDCDDTNYFAHPGATERPIDGIDEDCNGLELCFEDVDGDGFGNPNRMKDTPFVNCNAPGVTLDQRDCNDTFGSGFSINPDATEQPVDNVDSDCDLQEACYYDNDGDHFGNKDGRISLSFDLTCKVAPHVDDDKLDCNDEDALSYPGAPDPQGDGLDQNCDGLQDCFADLDGDGFGGPNMQSSSAPNCAAPGLSPITGDCDDRAVLGAPINPNAVEVANDAIDQNCDGLEACFKDLDGDHFGRTETGTSPVLACTASGFSQNNLDCDDEPAPGRGPTIYPTAPEIPLNGFDEDCDGSEVCYLDADNDSYGSTTTVESTALACNAAGVSLNSDDCKDNDGRVNPAAAELVADGVDSNCDAFELCYVDNDLDSWGNLAGATTLAASLTCSDAGVANDHEDCNDNRVDIYPNAPAGPDPGTDYACSGFITCFRDTDADGYGGSVSVTSSDRNCAQIGLAKTSSDCNDADAAIHPGAVEVVASGGDQDCDGFESCYQDLDDDGFGGLDGAGAPIIQFSTDTTCTAPFVAGQTGAFDCDDFDADTNPSAPEQEANGVDNDCDGTELCYIDHDLDNYGDPSKPAVEQTDLDCTASPSAGYANNKDDCDDTLFSVHPLATEIPVNNIDEDCDAKDACWQDLDHDGYGNSLIPAVPSPSGMSCTVPGVAPVGGDCVDADGSIHPTAAEIAGDGIDQDCDLSELCYVDADHDHYGGPATPIKSSDFQCSTGNLAKAGGDCVDNNSAIHPGATETAADGIDQDCDAREVCWIDRDKDDYGDLLQTELSADFTCSTTGIAGNDVSNHHDDCYDFDAAVHPNAPEVAGNGRDENCDGKEACYQDVDVDHHGDTRGVIGLTATLDCSASGVAPVKDDCNDADSTIFPGATETPADRIDSDCDQKEDCYTDNDWDTYGVPSIKKSIDLTCTAQGVSPINSDCNDTVPEGAAIHPGAVEVPGDGFDQNCDNTEICFRDGDGDHFGTSTTVASPSMQCNTAGSAPVDGDCDDANVNTYPGRADVPANGIDDNCDGHEECWQDYDRDTYGGTRTVASSDLVCTASGESAVTGDCVDDGVVDNGGGIVSAVEIHPGADEVCNLVDDDCDEAIDDADGDVLPPGSWYPDDDGDRFGDLTSGVAVCAPPGAGWTTIGFDCNDGDDAINPAATEVCDPANVDENCNGLADDADVDAQGVHLAQGSVTVHPDADEDGYGSSTPGTKLQTCDPPPGMLEDGTDCIDSDAAINPGELETAYDGLDNDCNTGTKDDDLDGDGYTKRTQNDCNDNPGVGVGVHPTAPELPNGIDDDCDGKIDEGTIWGDDDGDGLSEAGGDCLDSDKRVHPGATELVNGVDDDCDGAVDEGTPRNDDDHDGYTENQRDCNDADASINPGVVETCPGTSNCDDGIDNDCNGSVDGGAYDPDHDGYTGAGGDCAEADPAIHPGATEVPNGVDDDCDEVIDEGTTWSDDDGDGTSEDADHDGQPDDGDDCNDANAEVHPGADEVTNGVDDDCDGDIDENTDNADDDHDGFAENQGDCDDADPAIFPGADEVADGKDQDCDGVADDGLDDADGDGVTEADGDCNDHNGWVKPGATEVQDGLDNDCNGVVDDVAGDDECPDGQTMVTTGCGSPHCSGEGNGCSNGSSGSTSRSALALIALLGAGLRRRRKAA